MDLLCEIAAATRHDLVKQKMLLPEEEVFAMCQGARPVRDFAGALKRADRTTGAVRIAGRVEKADPESGVVRENFDALALAQALQKAGTAALAVVTEPHFYFGKNSTLSGVARLATVPVARFDCVLERYQIAQTYLWGGDAVTLFPAVLTDAELADLCDYAATLKLGVFALAYTQADLERLLAHPSIAVIGVYEAELLSQIPPEKCAVFCGETPEYGADAWMPEHRIMAASGIDELQKLLAH